MLIKNVNFSSHNVDLLRNEDFIFVSGGFINRVNLSNHTDYVYNISFYKVDVSSSKRTSVR